MFGLIMFKLTNIGLTNTFGQQMELTLNNTEKLAKSWTAWEVLKSAILKDIEQNLERLLKDKSNAKD